MFMITKAIEAFCEMVKQGFTYGMIHIVGKPNSTIIKDKKSLKKGTDYAEKIIDLCDKYQDLFDAKDRKKYTSLKNKFKKYN